MLTTDDGGVHAMKLYHPTALQRQQQLMQPGAAAAAAAQAAQARQRQAVRRQRESETEGSLQGALVHRGSSGGHLPYYSHLYHQHAAQVRSHCCLYILCM
jgi:hypothetical protein